MENIKWHEFEINNSRWVVPVRYSMLTPLGQGAYGLVCSAYDNVRKERVAIKKISRPFATNVHAKRAFREIKLLRHVVHENIIQLYDIFSKANCPQELDDIYLVTILMTTDLNNVLKTQELSKDQILWFTYQILRGLKYLHTSNIIHRIIDFGLARSEREEMTGYVATRWYRAPEIMLRWMHYTKAVDVWSVGCILVEMFLHRPLFPGSDHVNQLNRILDVVGYPPETLINQINEDARTYLEKNPKRPPRVNFSEYFHEINAPEVIDLIDKMLQLDPNDRITVEQALAHDCMAMYHDLEDEPEGHPFDDLYEREEFSVDEWKTRIFNEISTFITPPPPPPTNCGV